MEENRESTPPFDQLLRLALVGDTKGAANLARRYARSIKELKPERASALQEIVKVSRTKSSPFREAPSRIVPVDSESRHDLLRIIQPGNAQEPLLIDQLRQEVDQVILERKNLKKLMKSGFEPTRSLLLTGLPGIGKTMTARWIAQELGKPLFVLDLASVMSSYLGRTGSNLKSVLDFAKREDGILLLDEFDAIAKRRNDDSEIGELKRLVTVLIQEIDVWPVDRLLIAATNHGELLDPAIWRRFEVVLRFPEPDRQTMAQLFKREAVGFADPELAMAFALVLPDQSYGEALQSLRRTMRNAVVLGRPIDDSLADAISKEGARLAKTDKKELATILHGLGWTQRRVHEVTGLARETLRGLDVNWGGKRG